MGFFGFGKKVPPVQANDATLWFQIASKIASNLEGLLQVDPKALASPYARVMLRQDWNVAIACDKRDPDKLLGTGDVSFAFLREDEQAFNAWVAALKTPGFMQQVGTDEFAKALTRKLRSSVNVVG